MCLADGRVLSDITFDDRPEWRRFPRKGESKGLERGSRPLTFSYHNGGVGAELKIPKRRYTRSSMRLKKMKRGTYRPSATRRERALIESLSLMHRIIKNLNIPSSSSSIKEVAGKIIRQYLEERRAEGRRASKATIVNSKEKLAVAVAAIRKALVIHNLPVSESELYEAASSEDQEAKSPEFKNYVWKIMKRMNDYGVVPAYHMYGKPTVNSRLMRIDRYIGRLLSDLALPPTLRRPALRFLETAVKSGKSLWGRKPEAVAAAAVYLVARLNGYENITQKKVASVYKLSEANVRKTFRYLIEDLVMIVGV